MSGDVTITFHFDPREDRLFILLGTVDEPTVLALTRRITARLADALAQTLERLNGPAQRAPVDLRQEVVRMTHEGAVARTVATATPWTLEQARERGNSPILVERVDLRAADRRFAIDLFDTETVRGRLTVDVETLHQLLETLLNFAERAEWNIAVDRAWLRTGLAASPAQGPFRPQ